MFNLWHKKVNKNEIWFQLIVRLPSLGRILALIYFAKKRRVRLMLWPLQIVLKFFIRSTTD